MRFFTSVSVLLVSLFLFSQTGISQNSTTPTGNSLTPKWVEMMQDPGVNFYDVQQEANLWFESHKKGKGSGYKQFKRWEYLTEQRVYPSGDRLNHPQLWDEITRFNEKYPATEKSSRSNWSTLGPVTSANVTGHWSPGIGRINVIALEPGNDQTIYIGSPSGGLWKTVNEGLNWEPLTDYQPVLGVSAIAIDPDNTDIIYIGTGDKDANDNYSVGILKSMDGGQTWNTTGMEWNIYQNRTISKLLINPNSPNILFAATTSGLFKTEDAGATWANILSGDIDDLEFKPGDPNTIYAITRRFFKSVDGGASFTETTGVPISSRAQIAVTEANPEYVYFYSSGSGIYRSGDGGDSFTFRSDQPTSGNQAWYDLALCVSHVNPEEVHLGEFNTWKSSNGALTWTETTDWTWGNSVGYTHCDIHEMVYYGGTMYVGSDGLITKTTDDGATWINLTEGVGIRQFYRIGTSKNDPYKILGGSQDNGTSVYSYDHWHEWLGADGMECLPDYSNSDIVYGTSQNGTFYKSNAGGNFGDLNIAQPGEGNWITPFVIHPTDPQTLYVGNSEVRKTTNGMNSWSTISSFGMGNLENLSISESDPNYLYTSKTAKIYRTKDGGESWTNISSGLPNLSITYIAIHPENPEIIAVSLSGYTDGEKVYMSTNGGATWTNYSRNLPNIPANCVAFYLGNLNPLYVGMDVGVYYIDENQTDWMSFIDGLPNVIVKELEIQNNSQLIRAATYGRGLWETSVILNAPVADFEAEQLIIPVGCDNSFTSLSQGPPATYEWTFEGGSPSTSTEKNPSDILYSSEGTYDVQLIVTNSIGADTLLKENYITISNSLLPAPDFTTSDSVACSNQVVEFIDQSLFCPVAWEWSFAPQTYTFVENTTANSQNPKVVFEPGVYSVTLTSTNSIGSNTITKPDYIHSGGSPMPFVESFEVENMDISGWTVVNPDGLTTWATTTVAGSEPGDKAAFMNIINYPEFGQRDRLISPTLNLKGYDNLSLIFDHAYALRYMQIDSLCVYISTDCGDNWTKIYANGPDGAGVFETSPTTTEPFIPQDSEDWCGEGYGSSCISIDISNWIGNDNCKIMFEAYSNFGNNLYIDNVQIVNNLGFEETTAAAFSMEIVPNPSNGIFHVTIKNISEPVSLKIRNMQGQVILSEEPVETKATFTRKINLSNQAKGIYFVEITTNSGTEVRKIVIK
ncbi:MAG: PKD domain-containing protein [Bacteroidales bacterium]|jgi:PKD repeat protein